MLFICYPTCSTCKKAEKWLQEKKISFQFRSIQTQNPTFEELTLWYKKSGLPLKRFFNTSGQAYRNLRLKELLPTMTEEEQLALLATDGMLVKRPILVTDTFVLIGFNQSQWEEAFLSL
ncbi:MAG: arsenate reductase family protein [Clostridiales bacterium]|nr:arsenate reductase family protein [Clostridiales bacterium]